jgi:hypothetical protein
VIRRHPCVIQGLMGARSPTLGSLHGRSLKIIVFYSIMGSPTRLMAAIGSHTGSWTRENHWGFEQHFWFASLVLCTLIGVCSGQSAGLNRSSHPQFYDFLRGNSQAYNPVVPYFTTTNVLHRCSFYFRLARVGVT